MKNFIIALLLGIVLGAAGYWFIQQPTLEEAGQRAEQKATEMGKAVSGAAEDTKQAMAAKLEVLKLRAQDIRDELQQTGKVVRRSAREVGKTVADAAADARITAEIKRKLAVDTELSVFTISVNTTEGRVTLSGTVSSPDLIGKAILLALETDGVREVVSTLQVK